MKKWICMLLAAMMVLSLAACGETEKDNPADPAGDDGAEQVQSIDLKAAAEEAIAAIASDEVVLMPEENTDAIEALYPGLTAAASKQLVVYLPPVVGNACEVVLAEAASSTDAETIRSILQKRVDDAANDTTYPENAEGWKNRAVVTVNENYVVMAVLPEGTELPAAFRAEF